MIRRMVFIAVLIGAFIEAGPSVVWAGDVTVTVGSQVMAPAMALNPDAHLGPYEIVALVGADYLVIGPRHRDDHDG